MIKESTLALVDWGFKLWFWEVFIDGVLGEVLVEKNRVRLVWLLAGDRRIFPVVGWF